MFRSRVEPEAISVQVVDDLLVVAGPDLDAVLEVVGDRLGPGAEVVDARREIVGGVRGFFGRERFTVQARVVGAPAPVTAPAPATSPEQEISPQQQNLEEPVARALDGAAFAAELARALAESSAPTDATPEPPAAADEADAVGPGTGEPLDDPDPEPVAAYDPGVALLALTAPDLPRREVVDRLTDLVLVPPALPGSGVVAVVGDAGEAVAAAEQLAASAGTDPSDVLVMAAGGIAGRPAWLTMTDPADAARRRERWEGSGRLVVVAVAVTPGTDGMDFACRALDALSPDQTRLAVPGWRRAEEVLPRLRALAPVDAIDLAGPVDPVTSAEFLGLTVPVATLDGAPATLEAWTDHLRAGRDDAITLTATAPDPEDAGQAAAHDAPPQDAPPQDGAPPRRRSGDRRITAPSFPTVSREVRR